MSKRRNARSSHNSGGVNRLLNFDLGGVEDMTPRSTSRQSASSGPCSFYGSSSSSLRSRSTTDDNVYWQRGQYLPYSGGPPSQQTSFHDVTPPTRSGEVSSGLSVDDEAEAPSVTFGILAEILKQTVKCVNTEISKVNDTLTGISGRLDDVEGKQSDLEKAIPSTSSSESSKAEPGRKKRNRLTPIALQNKIHMVHNAFDEDMQFRPNEAITSTHNSEVVKKIILDIGTEDFGKDLIQKACKTYRKTLAEKTKGVPSPVKKKKQLRSLKQRSYERRSKAIKVTSSKEMKYWSQVTPDMLSDEEKVGDTYVRHQPSYRSGRLNKFIEKLDKRLEDTPTTHPRHVRVLGSPVEASPPAHAKPWMIVRSLDADQRENEEETQSQDSSSDCDNDPL